MYACLYSPPGADQQAATLVQIAHDFSPRYERHRDDLVVIDVAGLERLIGPARAIGDELRRAIASHDLRAHVAVAGTQTAALVLAQAQPGLTVVLPGAEEKTLAPVAIGVLGKFEVGTDFLLQTCAKWGVRTLGDLASLPTSDLVSRLGRQVLAWQAIARGMDLHPLIPTLDEERFESTLELEWPIDGLEPLSFVLTRLLEPLSTRLERRDRGAAVLHVLLQLVGSRDLHARRLELPSPMRDVRTLRTLALLDLEAHPPAAAIDRVSIVIDPTPGRVLQHTLFTRPHPTPEQISTLLARLGAVMGQDRIGAPVAVDTDRPGAFAMAAYRTEHSKSEVRSLKSEVNDSADFKLQTSDFQLSSALRRCRVPVPARVAVAVGRPVRVTTDRRGFTGGAVVQCAGPWRTSGQWWKTESLKSEVRSLKSEDAAWNRDEWDVALSDGTVYRVFHDRDTDGWFIDAIAD